MDTLEGNQELALREKLITQYDDAKRTVGLGDMLDPVRNFIQTYPEKSDGVLYFMLARCYDARNQTQLADPFFKKALLLLEGSTDAKSLTVIGHIYSLGYERDDLKAFKFYSAAAQLKSTEAQYKVAEFYRSGRGVEKNYEKAFQGFQTVIKEGDIPFKVNSANFSIGVMYQSGQYVPKDFVKALEYYKKTNGHEIAQHNMGVIYLHGGHGVTMNKKNALKYFQKSADQGYKNAQYALGNLFHRERKYVEALSFYKMASDQGSSNARFRYALMLDSGVGIPRNPETVFRYFHLAADGGHREAQFHLARLYACMNGYYNLTQALLYFKKADDQGYPSAARGYAEVLHMFRGIRGYHRIFDKYQQAVTKQRPPSRVFRLNKPSVITSIEEEPDQLTPSF